MTAQSNQKIKVNLLIENSNWKKVKSLKPFIESLLIKTLQQINFFKLCPVAEITIKLTDDPELLRLNNAFFNKNKPTNVLSFPFYQATSGKFILLKSSKKLYLGDIALSYTTIYNESVQQDKSFEAHFMHLLIHGILHLCGYDHDTTKKAKKMEALEIEILRHFNITNPYEVIIKKHD